MRTAKRLIENRFGSRSDIDNEYCEGSRTLRDILETIVHNDLKGDIGEADFWRGELSTLFPHFQESI